MPLLIFAGTGAAAGALLTVASKLFEVKTDERVSALSEILPQINCGACGFSGCSDYANAIVTAGAPINACAPGGSDCALKIAEIMGVEARETIRRVAVVHCSGDCDSTESKYVFKGTDSCLAANRFYSGSEVCTQGCLGFGDCASVCPEGAISVSGRLASVNRSKCMGCGLCVAKCPNGLISLRNNFNVNNEGEIPLPMVDVRCSSTQVGKIVRSVCKNGCIGCKLCEKKCPEGAVKVVNNLAVIDYDKCTSCGVCADTCPSKVIRKCAL